MEQLIFQEKNLKDPVDVYNFIGQEEYTSRWSELPLKILKEQKIPSDMSNTDYNLNLQMAEKTFKLFCDFLKEGGVSIYTTQKPWDETCELDKIIKWEEDNYKISRDHFFLMELDKSKNSYEVLMARRQFWIEMPRQKNPMLLKKSGTNPTHDKKYLLSIFDKVITYIRGNVSCRSVSNAYADYFKDHKIDKIPPSKSWVDENFSDEVKNLKESR